MKFVPNGSIIKFLLIAVLGCGLAFLMAWLTTMFTVIKITQGVSLAGVALILLWCVVIGGAAVWSICAFCALYVGTWRKHHVDHAIRLSEAMLMLHASTNHEQLEALRHYRIRVFKSHEAIPAGGKLGVDCREVSNFLSPMLFGFNKFFALGSPEYCCDATQLSAIVEENQTRWCGESSVAPSCDAAKLNREIEELKKKYKGVVYKRRVRMPLNIAAAYLTGRCPPPDPGQITREIDWFRSRYPGLAPAMYLSYERSAFCGRDDNGLRITFDRRILWRRDTLDLTAGSGGSPLLAPDERLMEIKCVGAMPLWLAEALSDLAIWPSTFSKYGNAYKESLLTADAAQALGGIDCA